MGKPAVLYTFWDNGLVKQKGWIDLSFYKEAGRFVSMNKNTYICSMEVGKVYRNNLWFYSENDNDAIGLFMEQEQKLYDKYKNLAKVHVNKLRELKTGGIKNVETMPVRNGVSGEEDVS